MSEEEKKKQEELLKAKVCSGISVTGAALCIASAVFAYHRWLSNQWPG